MKEMEETNHATLHQRLTVYQNLVKKQQALEQELKEVSAALYQMELRELPGLMDTLGFEEVTCSNTNGGPKFAISVKDYYRANIAAGWDDKRRAAAFKELERCEGADLITDDVVVGFTKTDHEKATGLYKQLINQGLEPKLKQNVNHMTLTAWLKERITRGLNPLPDLDLIGGEIGQVAKVKIIEEDKHGG